MYVCMYIWCFRARQHLRSLAPVMNADDNDGQMIFGDVGGLKLPDICLIGEEKPRKNLTQETCPDRGSNPGPLRDRRACYRLSHRGGPWQMPSSICNWCRRQMFLFLFHVFQLTNSLSFCFCWYQFHVFQVLGFKRTHVIWYCEPNG